MMFEVKEEKVVLPLDNPEELPLGVRIASKFSVAEQNLVCIYKKNNKYETIQAITWSIPYVNDEDMIALMGATVDKLDSLTDIEFEMAEFVMTEPDENEDGSAE